MGKRIDIVNSSLLIHRFIRWIHRHLDVTGELRIIFHHIRLILIIQGTIDILKYLDRNVDDFLSAVLKGDLCLDFNGPWLAVAYRSAFLLNPVINVLFDRDDSITLILRKIGYLFQSPVKLVFFRHEVIHPGPVILLQGFKYPHFTYLGIRNVLHVRPLQVILGNNRRHFLGELTLDRFPLIPDLGSIILYLPGLKLPLCLLALCILYRISVFVLYPATLRVSGRDFHNFLGIDLKVLFALTGKLIIRN